MLSSEGSLVQDYRLLLFFFHYLPLAWSIFFSKRMDDNAEAHVDAALYKLTLDPIMHILGL
jgi:hypothetical protein